MTEKRIGINLCRQPWFRKDHLSHNIPLGQVCIVKVGSDGDYGECSIRNIDSKEIVLGVKGEYKLIVVGHGRDCDGEPLYALSDLQVGYPCDIEYDNEGRRLGIAANHAYRKWSNHLIHGYSEESLQVVENEFVPLKYSNIWEYEDSIRRMFSE